MRLSYFIFSLYFGYFIGLALSKEWLKTPYDNDDDFNVQAKYKEYKTLFCNDSRIKDHEYAVKYWILPDLTILKDGHSISFPTLDGIAYWNVTMNGKTLEIGLVQERHFGFYHCVVTINKETKIVKKALNYHGPYFGNLWQIYKKNTMIGGIAGGSMALILICCSIFYTFKYNEKDEKIEKEIKDDQPNSVGHENSGYEITFM